MSTSRALIHRFLQVLVHAGELLWGRHRREISRDGPGRAGRSHAPLIGP